MRVVLSAIILCVLFATRCAFAQTLPPSKEDSLKVEIRKSSGKSKADLLAKLAAEYVSSSFDSSFTTFAKAESLYKESAPDTVLFLAYLDFGRALENRGHANRALDYFKLARKFFVDKALPAKFEMVTYEELGLCYYWMNQHDSSLYYNLKYYPLAKDSLDIVVSLKRIALNYRNKGMSVKALEYNLKVLRILDTYERPQQKASIYLNLGNMYDEDGDAERAKEYYLKALGLYSRKDNPRGVFYTYSNLGVLAEREGKYAESLEWLSKAEDMLPELNNEASNVGLTFNKGNTLTHMGNHKEGIELFKKALVGYSKLEDDWGVSTCYRQMGEAYYLMKNYKEAEKNSLQALAMANKFEFIDVAKTANFDLFHIYAALNQFQKAYNHQTQFIALKDSLSGPQQKSKLGLLEKEFQVSQAESEKERLANENQIQKLRSESDRKVQWALGIALLLFIAASAVIIIAFLRAKRRSDLLALQKKTIEEQSNQLKQAADTKARFFANVSHELRTPVTLLNGMLELMQEELPSLLKEKKMEVALGSSRRLNSLLDEVLDLSKLEAGNVVLKKKNTEVLPLLNRIVMAFESLLVKKNIQLRYEASALKGIILSLDEDKFEKVINNLIYNALKFNKENGWIKVEGLLNSGKDKLIIRISDSGVGIRQEDLPFIFDRFYQSGHTEYKNSQGVGIGLSLVKEFTVLHEGEVAVTSSENEGACFTLQFPITNQVAEHFDQSEENEDIKTEWVGLEGNPKILLVEDNEEMRFYLREILGANVIWEEAVNGKEALKKLKSFHPDLILSDVMMPEMDGYELLNQLKSSEKYKSIPVVMLTARASEEDLLHGLTLGVDDYIVKPFNAKELNIRIHNLLTNQKIRNQWKEKPVEKGEEITIPTEDQVFLQKIQEFVEQRAQNALLGIIDLADYMAMSERQLYRKCGAVTGMTPAHLIKEIRLKIAYRLLVDRKVNKVGELATRVGFDNSNYFSKQFAERFGKRPVDML